MKSLEGIFSALVTPLKADETVDTAALEQLLERVYAAGVHGVYVCGSTGEGQSLTESARRTVAEVVARNTPADRKIIVHVAAASFREATSLARHAAANGAVAFSSIRPVNASWPELKAYYRDLAASTDLPFLAYYFPTAADQLTYSQLSEICDLPGIAGLKFTDYDLFTLSSLVRAGHTMFNGRDEVLAAGLLLGAHGGIGSIYNLVPGMFVDLFHHARAGRWAEAVALQNHICILTRILIRFPFIAALKQYLRWEGIECGRVTRPRMELTEPETAELKAALRPLGLITSL